MKNISSPCFLTYFFAVFSKKLRKNIDFLLLVFRKFNARQMNKNTFNKNKNTLFCIIAFRMQGMLAFLIRLDFLSFFEEAIGDITVKIAYAHWFLLVLQAADGVALWVFQRGKCPINQKPSPFWRFFRVSEGVKRPKIDLAALWLLLSARWRVAFCGYSYFFTAFSLKNYASL